MRLATKITLYVFFTASLIVGPSISWLGDSGAAYAFHFPWDQGHDTFKPVPPPPPNDPCSKDGSKAECDPCKKTACPVSLDSGNGSLRSIDLGIEGFGSSLSVARTYNSRDVYNGIFGRGWIFDYGIMAIEVTDGIDEVVILRQSNGERLRYLRNADGSYSGPSHDESVLVKESDGSFQLTRVEGGVLKFLPDGRLGSVTGESGQGVDISYRAEGCIEKLSDQLGRTIQFICGPNGRVASVTDFSGRTVSYQYDDSGYLILWTDADGRTTAYAYDDAGRMIEAVGPLIHSTMTYDPQGRVASVADTDGTFRFSYDSATSVRKIDAVTGATWTYTLDPLNGYITQVRYPNGSTSSATYNATGRITSSTRRSGAQYLYAYDDHGNNTSVTGPSGERVTYTYSTDGRDLIRLDQNGFVTEFDHNTEGEVVAMTEAPGTPDARSYGFEENASGLVTAKTDPDGGITHYSYDARGLLVAVTKPSGATTSYAYDMLGRLISITDPNGNATQYELSPTGNLLRVTDPLGYSVTFSYNGQGGLATVTDANGHTTTFTTDEHGRLLSKTGPLGQTTNYQRDSHGWLTSISYPDGLVADSIYDFEGRLSQARFSGGGVPALTEIYTYGNGGELEGYSDGSISIASTYGPLQRVLSQTNNLVGKTVSYAYSDVFKGRPESGIIASIQAGDGVAVSYEYDALSRVIGITQAANAIVMRYDSMNRVVERQLPGGIAAEYSHDPDGNLSILLYRDSGGAVLVSRSYVYDGAGNVLQEMDEAGQETIYHYDAASQLIRVELTGGGGEVRYEYDGNGNRTRMVDAGGIITDYEYDANNRLLTDGARNYLYDAQGNLINIEDPTGNTRFSYDARNRLISVRIPTGEQVDYRYGLGSERLERRVGTQISRYTYVRGERLAEYNGTNALTREHLIGDPGNGHMDDGFGVSEVGGTKTAYLRDGIGSVVGMAGSTGALVASLSYGPFGEVVSAVGDISASELRFQGRPLDPLTDTMDFRFREYAPSVGRFLQADPATDFARLGDYVFVGNNPRSNLDPWGLFTVDSSCTDQNKQRLEACALDVRNTVNKPPYKCFIGKELGKKLLVALDDTKVGCYSATDAKCSGNNKDVLAWGSTVSTNPFINFCPTGLGYSYGNHSSLCPVLMHELVHNTGESDEDVAHGCERRCYEGRGGYPEGGGTQTCKDCK